MRKLVSIDTVLEPDQFTQFFVQYQITRQASHGQLKALFSQIEQATGKTAERFCLPLAVQVRRLRHQELRVVASNGEIYLVNKSAGTRTKVWPKEVLFTDYNLLIQVTDRGLIVTGALNFMLEMNYLTCVFFGFFHTQWNALKNAAKCAMGGKCWATIVKLMIVWNMNASPFRSGQWYRSKQEALSSFVDSHGIDPEIRAILPEMARRRNLRCNDADSEEKVYRTCFCSMRSFVEDGPVLKLMRWCGLKQVRDFYHAELPGLRLILLQMAGKKRRRAGGFDNRCRW